MIKNLKICLSIISVFFIVGCISQSDFDKTNAEKNAVIVERNKLKQELEELKFGAPTLMSDGQAFYKSNDFASAKEKFHLLLERYPTATQAIDAKRFLSEIYEEESWLKATNSTNASFSKAYMDQYPKGKYTAKANIRYAELKILNMEDAYKSATQANSSSALKTFLLDYPSFKNASDIQRRIIQLEVDEISRSSETGAMPEFNHKNSGYSSGSSVEIKNDTGCELTIRYSGNDVKMIVIPEGATRSVSLSSGNYRIAASACGSDYAGVEDLGGNYNSTFYISKKKY